MKEVLQQILETLENIASDVLDNKTEILKIRRRIETSGTSGRLHQGEKGRHVASNSVPIQQAKVRVTGSVVNEALRGITGVGVTLYDAHTNEAVGTSTSGSTGEWLINVHQTGSYVVEYKKPGMETKNTNIIIPEGAKFYKIARGR